MCENGAAQGPSRSASHSTFMGTEQLVLHLPGYLNLLFIGPSKFSAMAQRIYPYSGFGNSVSAGHQNVAESQRLNIADVGESCPIVGF